MLKPLIWHRTSRRDLKTFPEEVQDHVGYALHMAQIGEIHNDSKHLKGMPGILEVVSRFDANSYRAVYYTKVKDKIVVLHCFQKKSKHGIATPPQEMDVIKQRWKEVREGFYD